MGIGTFIEKDSSSSSAPRRATRIPPPGLGAFAEKDSASSTAPRRAVPRKSTKGTTFIEDTNYIGIVVPPLPSPITYYEIIDDIEYYVIENNERYYETVY